MININLLQIINMENQLKIIEIIERLCGLLKTELEEETELAINIKIKELVEQLKI